MESIISFIIILSILVLVHELGHFISARYFKIKVEEFGFGYPPRIWGKKIKETVYSLNWLPFGGFVRMLGEDSGDQVDNKKEMKRSFFSQKKSVRIIVLLAGVVMNFLLGVFLFAIIYTKIGIPTTVDYLVVSGVAVGSPAEKAGLQLKDNITRVDGLEWSVDKKARVDEFIRYISDHGGEEVRLTLADGRVLTVVPRVKSDIPKGEGALGVAITNVDLVLYPFWQRPFRGMIVGVKEAVLWGKDILVSLGVTLGKLVKGNVPKDVAGPVGIYEISKDVVEQGWLATLQFVAILSINLSILNLLPMPALDGGRLLFVLIEAVTKKRVNPKIEQVIHLAGMALLLSLMVLVTIGDIKRLLAGN